MLELLKNIIIELGPPNYITPNRMDMDLIMFDLYFDPLKIMYFQNKYTITSMTISYSSTILYTKSKQLN